MNDFGGLAAAFGSIGILTRWSGKIFSDFYLECSRRELALSYVLNPGDTSDLLSFFGDGWITASGT